MLTLFARLTRFGWKPCCPKKWDSAIVVLGVGASDWYGGRRITARSPLRFGCSESDPSTLRSCSFWSTLRDAGPFAGVVKGQERVAGSRCAPLRS